MAKKRLTNVKPDSAVVVLLLVAALVLISLLDLMGVANFNNLVAPLTTIGAALFLLTEVSVMATLKRAQKGKFNLVDWAIVSVGLLAIIGAGLGLLGLTLGFLTAFQIFVNFGLLIGVFVEIFR